MSTIFAEATAPARSGVSIVRISGPNAAKGVSKLCKLPRSGHYLLSRLCDHDGAFIDQALVLFFENGKSFTGEEVVELHLHGSRVIVSKILKTLSKITNFRLAKPGEFTRRALENSKLSLFQVEGLADLLDAETDVQHRQASRIFSGEFLEISEGWRKSLIRALAVSEASIDFSDEELPPSVLKEAERIVLDVKEQIDIKLEKSKISEKIKTGFEVAIIGAPNSGKSTLINALADYEVSLISNIPGTTRDVLEVKLDVGGLPVTFLDTAGLRQTNDKIEKMGINRALKRAKKADICVFLINDAEDQFEIKPRPDDIILYTKGDLRADKQNTISGKTGAGIPELFEKIHDRLSHIVPDDVLVIRERQKNGLTQCSTSLQNALEYIQQKEARLELFSTELYSAITALDFVIGRVDIENVLDEIFSSFCLGK